MEENALPVYPSKGPFMIGIPSVVAKADSPLTVRTRRSLDSYECALWVENALPGLFS